MEVPKAVLRAAGQLVTQYGPNFRLLGQYGDRDAWQFVFPENDYTGFPFVYLHKDGDAEEIGGELALDIVSSFDVE